MAADPIDALLERYLALLDEYTQLRAQLNALQAAMYQHIARANFAAERGIRYGKDYYDDRMQAARRVEIEGPNADAIAGAPVFKTACREYARPEPKANVEGPGTADAKDTEPGPAAATEKETSKAGDPLRWFGLLTPMHLRQAQSHAAQAIDEVVPKLVSVNAEMLAVEIEVRRARKKRAKADGAEKKPGLAKGQAGQLQA